MQSIEFWVEQAELDRSCHRSKKEKIIKIIGT